MNAVLALAAVLALLAGCVAPASSVQPASLVDATGTLRSYSGAGLLPVPADLARLATSVLETGQAGGEPTMGVDAAGALYVTGGSASVWKSADKGRSWANVADGSKPRADFDPYVWVDPVTDRIFSAPLYIACTNLEWSDDGGKTWTQNPTAGCGLPGHDHQSLVTGPPPAGVRTNGYPNVIYYTYNSFRNDGTWVVTSLDGGKSFDLTGTKISDGDDCQSSLNGAAAVAPDGTVFVPMARCDGLRVGVSKDAGKTWKTHDINDVGMLGIRPVTPVDDTPYTGNPGATVDAAGNAFVDFPGKDGKFYMARSADGGATWTKPVRASPPDVTSTAFPTIVSGAQGRVALAYFGTTADTSAWKTPSPQYAAPTTKWNLYLTMVTDATAADPVFTTIRVNPEDDPVQVGCIWLSGGVNDCRNLGDFMDITEREGRVYLVFPDGCRKCAVNTDSRGDDMRVAVVDAGPSLRGGDLVPYAAEALAGKTAFATRGSFELPRLP